jgi:hypothetical protein
VTADVLSTQTCQIQTGRLTHSSCCNPLQAAVRDAERCLGGASGLLGRAVQLGPHPYATLSLPAALVSSSSSAAEEGHAVQVLKTPFQVRRNMRAAAVVSETQLQLPAKLRQHMRIAAAVVVVVTQLQPLWNQQPGRTLSKAPF